MNTPVNFEISKVLKEKGFDEKCRFVHDNWNNIIDWLEDGEGEHRNSYKNASVYYSAPTIAEVVMWLFEKHGIWITTCIVADSYFSYWIHNKNRALQDTKSNWLTPTEAYEAAIIYTINNLI